jgi:hypothetical protein
MILRVSPSKFNHELGASFHTKLHYGTVPNVEGTYLHTQRRLKQYIIIKNLSHRQKQSKQDWTHSERDIS